MDRRKAMKWGLAAVTLPAAALAAETQYKFRDEFTSHWQQSREYTLDVAKAMPPEHYVFRPTAEIWSFGQQLAHIGNGIYLLVDAQRGKKRDSPFPEQMDKETAVKHLNAAFDFGAAALKELNDVEADQKVDTPGGRGTRREIFHLVLDHTTHHRGQCVIYLRLKGIVAPPYRE